MTSVDTRQNKQIDWLEISAPRSEPLLTTPRVNYIPGAFEIPHGDANATMGHRDHPTISWRIKLEHGSLYMSSYWTGEFATRERGLPDYVAFHEDVSQESSGLMSLRGLSRILVAEGVVRFVGDRRSQSGTVPALEVRRDAVSKLWLPAAGPSRT